MNRNKETIATIGTYALYGAVFTMPFSTSLCHAMVIVFAAASLLDKPIREKLADLKNNFKLIVLILFGMAIVVSAAYSTNTAEAFFAPIFFSIFSLRGIRVNVSSYQLDSARQ